MDGFNGVSADTGHFIISHQSVIVLLFTYLNTVQQTVYDLSMDKASFLKTFQQSLEVGPSAECVACQSRDLKSCLKQTNTHQLK